MTELPSISPLIKNFCFICKTKSAVLCNSWKYNSSHLGTEDCQQKPEQTKYCDFKLELEISDGQQMKEYSVTYPDIHPSKHSNDLVKVAEKKLLINCYLNDIKVKAFLDTVSMINPLSREWLDEKFLNVPSSRLSR